MDALLDVVGALMALLSVFLLVYGALLCLPWWLQRKRSVDAPAPTSRRNRARSESDRFSASKR